MSQPISSTFELSRVYEVGLPLCHHGRLAYQCPFCSISIDGDRINVRGSDARAVERAARNLAADAHDRCVARCFLSVVDAKINDPATTPDEGGRLRSLRDAASKLSRDVLIEHQAGM
jgi:hypothetical protein